MIKYVCYFRINDKSIRYPYDINSTLVNMRLAVHVIKNCVLQYISNKSKC